MPNVNFLDENVSICFWKIVWGYQFQQAEGEVWRLQTVGQCVSLLWLVWLRLVLRCWCSGKQDLHCFPFPVCLKHCTWNSFLSQDYLDKVQNIISPTCAGFPFNSWYERLIICSKPHVNNIKDEVPCSKSCDVFTISSPQVLSCGPQCCLSTAVTRTLSYQIILLRNE